MINSSLLRCGLTASLIWSSASFGVLKNVIASRTDWLNARSLCYRFEDARMPQRPLDGDWALEHQRPQYARVEISTLNMSFLVEVVYTRNFSQLTK